MNYFAEKSFERSLKIKYDFQLCFLLYVENPTFAMDGDYDVDMASLCNCVFGLSVKLLCACFNRSNE